MRKISREVYAAALQAALEERGYMETLREWENKPRRLFSARPRDPYPELRRYDFVNMATKAAYPYLNKFRAGKMGPEERKCSFECWVDGHSGQIVARYRTDDAMTNTFHEENLFFKEGYGLMHSYQESPDPEHDARSRALAFTEAINGRHVDSRGEYFCSHNAYLDDVRRDFKELLSLRFSRKERRDAVREVNAYIRGMDERFAKAESIRKRAEATNRPKTLFEWVNARVEMEELVREAREDEKNNTMELRAEYRGRSDAESRYRLHGMAEDVAVAFRGTGGESIYDVLDTSMRLFEMSDRKDPKAAENALAVGSVFARLARQDGFGTEEILDKIEEFCKSCTPDGIDGLEPGALYRYRKIIGEVDSSRIKALVDAVDKYQEKALANVPFGHEYEQARAELRKQSATRLFAEYQCEYNGFSAKEFYDDYHAVKDRPFTMEEALREAERYRGRDDLPLKQCEDNLKTLRERLGDIETDRCVETFQAWIDSLRDDEERFGRMVDKQKYSLLSDNKDAYGAGHGRNHRQYASQFLEMAAVIARDDPGRLKEFFKDCGIKTDGFAAGVGKPFIDAVDSLYKKGENKDNMVCDVNCKYVYDLAKANKESFHRKMRASVKNNNNKRSSITVWL